MPRLLPTTACRNWANMAPLFAGNLSPDLAESHLCNAKNAALKRAWMAVKLWRNAAGKRPFWVDLCAAKSHILQLGIAVARRSAVRLLGVSSLNLGRASGHGPFSFAVPSPRVSPKRFAAAWPPAGFVPPDPARAASARCRPSGHV